MVGSWGDIGPITINNHREKEIEMIESAVLETKLVSEIKGQFFIPSYQRGYRWEKDHILLLLNDIWENGEANYSLQPIVVKELSENRYELIDGQQRLTTLFLIMKYMKEYIPHLNQQFTLCYETRERSAEFLESLNKDIADDNIDFFHIYHAYQTIGNWFSDEQYGEKNYRAWELFSYFSKYVRVIWYQVSTTGQSPKEKTEDSTNLFTRLNVGKIPLTNAELVKALFLSKDAIEITEEKQLEISTSWDIIEKELHDPNLWAFLTNEKPSDYATRIELIFNLMADKPVDDIEKYRTFFYFINRLKHDNKLDIWKEIREYYLKLREWNERRNIYHKVGYLIATGTKLQSILRDSADLTKTEFEESLDDRIIVDLDLTAEDVLDLNYEKRKDQKTIEKVLLLFNVETTRILSDSSEKYSFDSHKQKRWTLEHIHAQNSEGLYKEADQREWLELHNKALNSLAQKYPDNKRIPKVIQKIEDEMNNVSKATFDVLFAEVFDVLSENEDRSYMNSISNMALLRGTDNTALSNSTFDVKRNKILEMDRSGSYIPICTRRVFLKYYTESENHQLHFWGAQDRTAYLDTLLGKNGIIRKYLVNNQSMDS